MLLRSLAATVSGGLLMLGGQAALAAPVAAKGKAAKASVTKKRVTAAAAIGDTPPMVFSNTGSTGSTGTDPNNSTGGVGGTSSNFSQQLGPNASYQLSGGASSILSEVTTGGQGGAGVSRGDGTSGDGGAGGVGGDVSVKQVGQELAATSVTSSSSAPAIVLSSTGGLGGAPGDIGQELGTPGKAGNGGAGGNVAFNLVGTRSNSIVSSHGWNGSAPGTTAVQLSSTGGAGGAPSSGSQSLFSAQGPKGGDGGSAGDINVTMQNGSIASAGSALTAVSQGGAGSDGAQGSGGIGKGQGGNGGVGGNGGAITLGLSATTIAAAGAASPATGTTVPIDGSGNTAQASFLAAGVLAQSLGGVGGNGGSGDGAVGSAGAGGAAGGAGVIAFDADMLAVNTAGYSAAGVVLQSIGGSGGNGPGAGGAFAQKAGNGGNGGNGATVTATVGGPGFIATQGDDSIGLVAQSIGGGGGYGGSVQSGSFIGGVAIGGKGEKGGDAGVVSLTNGWAVDANHTTASSGLVVSTVGEHSSALVAQSIGGGGGLGGSAASTVIGPAAISYAVGGQGGSGGDAGAPGTTWVSADNFGILSTRGDHSSGMLAQAVGGGGGDGGAAFSLTGGNQLNINVTVGGSGGSGGNAGDVKAVNHTQVFTSGADAWGVLAQSVSGGGGNGGSSTGTAYQIVNPASPIPSISVDVSVGGSGGSGGTSGAVTGTNNGLIMTGGAGAHGLMAQSIAGGGGNGGDSSALNESLGVAEGSKLDVTVNVGGKGGGAGAAGNVTATNAAGALIWTLGDSARGIFAQSVSGGGGTGGMSKSASNFLSQATAEGESRTLNLGGSGGAGVAGGTVQVENDGNILTLGDTADAIFAQSVGGGGGLGGQASSKGTGGNGSKVMNVAGASGSASDGGAVTVTNTGAILTRGGNSAGIYAQSIGGGGGKAGTPTAGGDAPALMSVQDYLTYVANPANKDKLASSIASYANGTPGFVDGAWTGFDATELLALAQSYHEANATKSPAVPSDPSVSNATVNLTLSGGNVDYNPAPIGSGGTVNVVNSGQVSTNGPLAAGIWAQSVGGGGGELGATDIAATTKGANTSYGGTSAVGGQGFNVGDGGAVKVSHTSTITTAGDASYGIFAQSIGAGGGHSGTTDSVDASTKGTLAVSIGGVGNVHGNGGTVDVEAVNGGNASIATTGNDAIGVFAQSIGGGGGTSVVMHTKASDDGQNMGSTNAQQAVIALQLESAEVGKTGPNNPPSALPKCANTSQIVSSCGNGNTVTVNVDKVSTLGTTAHGILAQSFGGSGGALIGASVGGGNPYTAHATAMGNGGNINATVNTSLTTEGAGAYGILAQSIGGGGILAGDLSTTRASLIPMPAQSNPSSNDGYRMGSGGNVGVTVASGAQITTSGANAHAIFAQSIGGGGGLISANTGAWMMGALGGSGDAGSISIVNNGSITVTGKGSSAIFTNAEGHNHVSLVDVENNGVIRGTDSAPVIALTGNDNTNGNGQVNNNTGANIDATNGTAIEVISASGAFAVVNNKAQATISGDVKVGEKGTFNNAGFWGTNGNSIGTVNNLAGATLAIRSGSSTEPMGTSTLSGNLVSDGNIATTVDFSAGTAGTLQVDGNVTLREGQIVVTPVNSLKPAPVTVITGGAVALSSSVTGVNAANGAVTYSVAHPANSNAITVTPVAQFAKDAANQGGSKTQQSVAAHLDAGFTNDVSDAMSRTYAKLANVAETNYPKALDSLANEGVQAIGTARLAASHAFVERMNSCPQFDGVGMNLVERDCAWTRAVGNQVDRSGDSSAAGYREDNSLVQFGGQKGIGNGWFLGASFGYDHSHLTADASSVSGHGWTAGVLIKRQVDDWLFSAAVDGGSGTYESQRQVTLGDLNSTATASFRAQQFGLHGRVARQFAMSDWYLKPYVDMHATRVHSGAYQETGAGELNLDVSSSSDTIYAVSPMLEAGRRFDLRDGLSLRTYASAGAALYSNNAWSANATLAGSVNTAGTFTATSALPNERFKLNAGVDLITTKGLDVRFEYSGEFARGYSSNTGSLKASYVF